MKLNIYISNITLLLLIFILNLEVFAQKSFQRDFEKWSNKKIVKKSIKENEKGNYLYSREMLEYALSKNPEDFDVNYQLGINYFVYTYDSKYTAVNYFEKALNLNEGKDFPELIYLLGQSYQQAAQFDSAIVKYNQFIPYISNNKKGKELKIEVNNRIAESNLGKSFVVEEAGRIRVENLGSNVNTQYREYVPVVDSTEEYIMFTARRIDNVGGFENIDVQDELHYEDMFISRKGKDGKYEMAQKFSVYDKFVGLIENTEQHEAVVSISKDEKRLLTYRFNTLWLSTYDEDSLKWTGPKKLNSAVNPPKTWQPHGSITSDGKKLYFSSNRENGYGGLDLYVSEFIDDTTWSEPKNLGLNFNTNLNEDSPFISEDGKSLYFSSQGHNTIGGYDIFRSTIDEKGEWSKPENIGRPINSPADDIYFAFVTNSRYAYFSSNREEGLGDLDIYRITFLKDDGEFDNMLTKEELLAYTDIGLIQNVPDTFIVGKPYEVNSFGTYVENGVIKNIYWDLGDNRLDKGEKLTYAYDKPGIYEVKMEVQAIDSVNFNTKNYGLAKNVVVLTQEDYDADKKLLAMERAKQAAIPTEIASEYETLKKERDFLLAQGAKPENKRLNELNARLKTLDNKIDDLAAKTKVEDKLAAAKSFGLGTVYFSFDKFYLHPTNVDVLENNLKVLKENKEIDVTLLGHTDNRATHEYNMILSRNRAKSVYEYLVKNGIDKKRLQYKGVATTQPENRCGVGVECDEVEHAINRRVEFFVDGKKMEDKKLNGPTIVRKLDGSESYSKYNSGNTSNASENNKALPQSSFQSTSNTSEVSLEQATIAKSVQGLSPVDEGLAFNNADGSVFCYTNVLSPEGYVGHITHVWKLEGKQMAKVKLKVRGPRWRTYSSKFMNDEMIGNWTVEVLNDKNELMKEFSFTVK